MNLITEDYRSQNRQLHESRKDFGVMALAYASRVRDCAKASGAKTILDYGCGKGFLKQELGKDYEVSEYDPAIPGKDKLPDPADLVVAIDVMEHIEPDCLEDVLKHIAGLSNKATLMTVAMVPAKKTLPDGRNAHLIVETVDWWVPRLMAHFSPRLLYTQPHMFLFYGEPL